MTYRAKGRHIIELIFAIAFCTFLVGFVAVLCVGNYFRAKRAQERQRQRREQKALQHNHHHHHQYAGSSEIGSYEAPLPPPPSATPA